MPRAAFGMDSLKEGGKIGLDITMVFSDDNGPAVIEWAQGCYVEKDSTVFAKVTLGEPMKAPARGVPMTRPDDTCRGDCRHLLRLPRGARNVRRRSGAQEEALT